MNQLVRVRISDDYPNKHCRGKLGTFGGKYPLKSGVAYIFDPKFIKRESIDTANSNAPG